MYSYRKSVVQDVEQQKPGHVFKSPFRHDSDNRFLFNCKVTTFLDG